MLKKFFNNDFVQNIIAYIVYIYVTIVYKTSKIIRKGDYNNVVYCRKNNLGLVLFIWHGRLATSLMELKETTKYDIYAISSNSRDGHIVSKILKLFNIIPLEGSTIDPKKGSRKNKRSLTVLRNIINILNNKKVCVFAADGPRGPCYKINTNILDVVKKTKSFISSVAISCKRKISFNTWDKFQFPLPFNKIIIEYGNVISIDENQDIETIKLNLENEINNNTIKNDSELNK